MSEPNDPFEARIRRLVGDAVDDSPSPPSIEEMMTMNRPTDDRHPARRRWIAGGTIGLVAAAVIALLVLPGNDDDAIQPVDTPAQVTTAEPATPTTEATPPTTLDVVSPVTTVAPASNTPSSTPTSTPITPTPAEPLTVIAAVDDAGDAVLIPPTGDPLVVFDGPAPDLPEPEEGPGPTVVDSIALRPAGHTVFVGLCCEPIAGSILSGSPADLGDESVSFGYAPAFSPDDRYLAVGQVQGPALAITDLETGFDLAVPEFVSEVGDYLPYDTMWLDASRVVGLGILTTDTGPQWVAVPMTIDGDAVAVGEAIDLSEILATFDEDTYIRAAGYEDADHFLVHVNGEPGAQSIEFRNDGVLVTRPSLDVGEAGVRSIWSQPGRPNTWVGEDGTLHRGDETIPGTYQWARPTEATTVDAPTPSVPETGTDPSTAIDPTDASVFGLRYGFEADPDQVVGNLEPSLGAPTFDTGWQPTPSSFDPNYDACFGPRFRTLWWGDFRITFGEVLEDGTVGVSAWTVGTPGSDTSAPVGEIPASRPSSGVAADGVGVGSSRADVLAIVPQDGRQILDNEDSLIVTGARLTRFDIGPDDTVTGIGSGRLDCTANAN